MKTTFSSDVAFLLPALPSGGVERVYLDLGKGLLDKGLDVELILAKAEGPLLSQVPSGIRLIDLDVPRRFRLLRAYGPLGAELRNRKPRVVVSTWGHLDVVPLIAAWQHRVPVLWVLHNTPLYLMGAPFPKQELVVWSARWALRRAVEQPKTRIGAVSKAVAETFSRFAGLPQGAIRVLPNPLPLERVRNLAQMPLSSIPIPDGAPYWVAVGRLHLSKGFDLLIRAFSLFHKTKPNSGLYLLILGEGPERSHLEKLILELGLEGRIFLLGHVSNPYPYIRGARALLMGSRNEGLPTVALEALALNVPVLATESEGGLREALGDGQFGLLVPRTPEDLARGMAFFWERGFDMNFEALENHLASRSLKASVEAYMKTFEELWS